MSIQTELLIAQQKKDAALAKLSERERIENQARREVSEADAKISQLHQQQARQQALNALAEANAAGSDNQAARQQALGQINALLSDVLAKLPVMDAVIATYNRQHSAAQQAVGGLEQAEIIRLTANLSPDDAQRAERQHGVEIREAVQAQAARITPAYNPSELLGVWVGEATGAERIQRRGLAMLITGIDVNPPPGWKKAPFDPYLLANGR